MILVIGGTGTIGAPLVEQLVSRGQKVRVATSRSEHKEQLQRSGLDAVLMDLNQIDSIRAACVGAEKMFLVTPVHSNMRQWRSNAITAAQESGIGHVVMSTGLGASPKSRLTFGIWHSENQEQLKQSDMDWTLVQPTYFMQNLMWLTESIATRAIYFDDVGGPVSWVDARDIADVSAEALTGEGHAGKSYGLTGGQALDGKEIAALLSTVTRREITRQQVSAPDARAAMISAGMNPEVADAMNELAALAPKGYLSGIETTIPDVLNRPARTFADFIGENAAVFGK